jgi:RNAse (barnase) inhibitor barstar
MKINWQEFLDQAKPFVIFNGRERDLGSLYFHALDEDGVVLRIVRGTKSHTRQDFFDEIAAAMQFPYYFGDNWDALNDCLTDLSWLPAAKYVLVVSNADELLSEESEDQLSKLLDILRRSATRWGYGINSSQRDRAERKSIRSDSPKLSIVLQVSSLNDLPDVFKKQVDVRQIPVSTIPPLDLAK